RKTAKGRDQEGIKPRLRHRRLEDLPEAPEIRDWNPGIQLPDGLANCRPDPIRRKIRQEDDADLVDGSLFERDVELCRRLLAECVFPNVTDDADDPAAELAGPRRGAE